ncbi:MAG: hypothetical protein JNJ60_13545 [Rhodocyclaceae bacterium]|nr:hypothetical protein [Rhodocyclaceae bacterium]
MSIRHLHSLLVLACCTLIVGCATNRSEVTIASPHVAAPSAPMLTGRSVYIRDVTDERVFEEAPKDPGTPSLGFEGSAKASDELKSRAIGRKRNTFGKALGDVVLAPGQSVNGLIRENVAAAMVAAGYQLADKPDATPAPLILDVHIKRFWSWFNPGAFTITLNAQVETSLEFAEAGAPATISVHATDSRMAATESSWIEIVSKGLSEYRIRLSDKAPAFPQPGNRTAEK